MLEIPVRSECKFPESELIPAVPNPAAWVPFLAAFLSSSACSLFSIVPWEAVGPDPLLAEVFLVLLWAVEEVLSPKRVEECAPVEAEEP